MQQSVGTSIINIFPMNVATPKLGNTIYAKGKTTNPCNKYTYNVRFPYFVQKVSLLGKTFKIQYPVNTIVNCKAIRSIKPFMLPLYPS